MKFIGKISVAAVFTAVLALIFSGCSLLDFFSTDALLRAPKLTGDNAELQKAFENSAGKDVSLLTPLDGQYKSAYIFVDLDIDGQDEALVFYTKKDNENVVHMHLLSYDGSEWKSVYDVTGNGSDVFDIDFYNLDGDSDREILVTWTVSDSKRDKTLSLYKLVSDKRIISPLATVQMNEYSCIDIDSDGCNELFYMYTDNSTEKYDMYAKVLKINSADNTMYPVSEIKLNTAIASIEYIGFEHSGGKCSVFLDCKNADEVYFTEIVAFDPEKAALSKPLEEAEIDVLRFTGRKNGLLSSDVNLDGHIEIPFERESESSYIMNTDDGINVHMRFTEWRQLYDNELKMVKTVYNNNYDGYSLNISEIQEYAYFVYDIKEHTIQAKLKEGSEKDELLFKLSCTDTAKEDGERPRVSISVTDAGRARDISRAFVSSIISLD